MGGTKKLFKFIVDWENGTRVAYTIMALIEQEMCINFAQLYLRNGYKPKNSIATGPLYVHTEFETNQLDAPT